MDNIVDESPLENAIKLAINTFKEKSKDNLNFLFIITSKDLKERNENLEKIIKDFFNNEIVVLSFFLTEEKLSIKKRLYDENEKPVNKNMQNLFKISSYLDNEDPFIKFLVLKKWEIPKTGKTKLFIEINIQNLAEIIELFNEAIVGLNNLFMKEIKENPNSLINIITNTVIDSMTQELIDEFSPVKQVGKTCYANAIAVALTMLSNKILVGNHFNYEKIRNIIIQKKTENKYKYKSTFNILNRFLKDCKKNIKLNVKKSPKIKQEMLLMKLGHVL